MAAVLSDTFHYAHGLHVVVLDVLPLGKLPPCVHVANLLSLCRQDHHCNKHFMQLHELTACSNKDVSVPSQVKHV